MSTSPIEDWLRDFTVQNMERTEPIQLNGGDIIEYFNEWLVLNNRKFETTKQKIGIKISNLRMSGITKGNQDKYGNATKMFDFKLLKKHFNIIVD